jgi:choline-sulfatase
MLVTERHKYNVFATGARREQLFDLQEDPGETRNLASSAAYAPVLASLRQRLQAWLEEIRDPFVL